ncbi:hypothetical protein BC834DRAFT_884308 [Gloeopeniophorella convolvens]|nr:hypothetical protein BC834DRAFT_884308 [Gloeopeniophorella convolvens]
MRLLSASYTLLASALLVRAQTSSDLPACAQQCLDSAIAATNCSSDDTACICASPQFGITGGTCLSVQCSDDDADADAGLRAFQALCPGSVPLPIPSDAPDPSGSSSSSNTGPTLTGGTATPTAIPTGTATTTGRSSSSSSNVASSTSRSSSASVARSSAPASSAPAPPASGNGAPRAVGAGLVWAGVGAVALAVF